MKSFTLVRARDLGQASEALASGPESVLKAGGTDLLDRLKEGLLAPERVVSLIDLKAGGEIAVTPEGPTFVGARATLAALADSSIVRQRHPVLAQAAGLAASPQIRRRATLGGNLAQHTRCGYYRLATFPCLKRGGDACPVRAAGGVQDTAGIFGNDLCASAHPSSVAPVLGALDAVVQVFDRKEVRSVPFQALWSAPARGRASDLALAPDALIVGFLLPAHAGAGFGYHEVRAKAAFDWPLVTAAVRLDLEGGKVKAARVWLGSVAPTPWRAEAAEQALVVGGAPSQAAAVKAGEAAVKGASPLLGNAHKVQLVQVAVKRAVLEAAGRR